MIAPERYTSIAQMDRERAMLWPRGWQLAGHASQLTAAGDFLLYEIGAATILIVHDGARVRAFHNVCVHRGTALVDEPAGRRDCFRCPYHHWEYAIDGTLIATPGATAKQRAGAAGLAELPCGVRHGLVWVCPGPAPRTPLDDFLAPLADRLAAYDIERLTAANRTRMAVPCNWKLSTDVHNEAYHVTTLHPELQQYIDAEHISVDLRPPHSRIVVPLRSGGVREQLFVFPNVQLMFDDDALQVYRHRPHVTDPARAWFDEERYQVGGVSRAVRELSFGETSMGPVTDADLAMLPRLQRGLASGGAGPLRLGPLEEPIALMHRGIDEYLA
jgi:nitrite reductase/ring-hydroxylating ferredoxin subunit